VNALVRSLCVVPIAAAALALPAAGTAAPASTSFKIVGFEYAFTPTVGSFAGKANGDRGDAGWWNAYVQHDRLGSVPAYVNGGSFGMATRSATGAFDVVTGDFTYHGGTITTLKPGTNCTNQQYRVTATIADVSTTTSSGGTGALDVTLTHYRVRVLGRCVAYKARVAGSVTFSY
jgi:hypothetical protein